MGQSTSLESDHATTGTAPRPSSSPSEDASECLEMEAMLSSTTATSLSPPPPLQRSLSADADGVGAAAASTSPAVTSVFCLDVSKDSLLLLRQLLETPARHRAAAFHTLSEHSKGLLLNAPGTTTVTTLQSFLLSQTQKPGNRGGRRSHTGGAHDACAERPSSLHMFALRDPTMTVSGPEGAMEVTREMSTDLLLPLTGATTLAALCGDATVLTFASAVAAAGAAAAEGGVEAQQGECQEKTEGEAAEDKTPPPRTVLLLYTRDSRFGFDGGDMLLIGCCVAICACIAAAICCCVTQAQNKKQQQQQSSSANDQKPNYNGGNNNGVPDYYGNNNNNNNSNYNNGNSQYNYNNGNYGQSPQPNGNYGNPYAPAGYNDNGNNNAAAPGYGVPPNAYGGNSYQPQYQPQQQNNNNNNNNGYYNGGSQQPSAPAPL